MKFPWVVLISCITFFGVLCLWAALGILVAYLYTNMPCVIYVFLTLLLVLLVRDMIVTLDDMK